MKILVTGVCGFIGSHFARYALKKGAYVVGVNRNTDQGSLGRIADIIDDPNFKLIYTDITGEVSDIMQGIDIVVNFAAKSIHEDMFVPIRSTLGTRTMRFKDLWEQQAKCKEIIKQGNDEIIKMKGRQVKALSFSNGGQWFSVKAIMRHWFKGKLIELEQKAGTIIATDNHSIYSSSLELTTPASNPELLAVSDVNENNKKYKKVSKDLLFCLAAYITEGCVCFNKANGGYCVVIAQQDREWLLRLKEAFKKEFNVDGYVTKKLRSSVYRLEISNKKLFKYLEKTCGKGSLNKKFPSFIFNISPENREYFWMKLCEGDGTKDGKRYGTVSYELANQISLLLALQQKKFKFVKQHQTKEEWNDVYHFRINQNSNNGLNKRRKREVDYEGWVYDLEIEKTHNFVCGIGNIVCHNTFVDHSILDPHPFIRSNIMGTYNLLNNARRRKLKKFIQISTDEVYGTILNGYAKETDELHPTNPYSASKASADMLALSYHATYGVPIIITRTENNYGAYQGSQKVVPTFIKKALNDEPLPVYGDGQHRRMWLRVEDHCSAIWHLLDYGREGQIYNIGAQIEKTNIELAEFILSVLGRDKSNLEFLQDHDIRPGHDRRYAINATKIMESGWMPEYNFEEGMAAVIDWYKRNKDWLR